MEKIYQLSSGILECYPRYAVFHFNADFYGLDEAQEFSEVIDSHYKRRKCVIISNREMVARINPEVYKRGLSRSVIGIAIVSNNKEVQVQATEEQGLFDGSFSYFRTIDEAANWARTVVSI